MHEKKALHASGPWPISSYLEGADSVGLSRESVLNGSLGFCMSLARRQKPSPLGVAGLDWNSWLDPERSKDLLQAASHAQYLCNISMISSGRRCTSAITGQWEIVTVCAALQLPYLKAVQRSMGAPIRIQQRKI